MKMIIKYVLSILMLNVLVGCGEPNMDTTEEECFAHKEYTEDYSKEYTEYFTYAFDKYDVKELDTFCHQTAGKVYDRYEVTYRDKNGVERKMTYSNVPGDLPSDVAWHAEDRTKEIVWDDYFMTNLEEVHLKRVENYDLRLEPVMFAEYDTDLIDYQSGTGIQFIDFDIKKLYICDLMMKINFLYAIETEEELNHMEDAKNAFLNLFNFIYEESENNNLTMTINVYVNGKRETGIGILYNIYYDRNSKQAVITEKERQQ